MPKSARARPVKRPVRSAWSQRSAQPAQADGGGGEVVVGVDTHKDAHVAAVLDRNGVLLGHQSFPTTAAGYQALLSWARCFGTPARAGVEGSGSYGVGLTRHLLAQGIEVIEVNQPDRATRRRRGKNDTIDAEAAARAVISGRASANAKSSDGPVEALRVLRLTRRSAVSSATQALNQLKAVIVSADPALRESLTPLRNAALLRRCAALTPDTATSTGPGALANAAVQTTLASLATRVLALRQEADTLHRQMRLLIHEHTPELLERPGIGPDNAAALLIAAGDNPERLHHEGSYVALCGASPIEASSGNNSRLRLNRGGDRQANSALYRITISRLRWDPRTQEYLRKRLKEKKTKPEIIRCIKRYIAREVFKIISPKFNPSPA